MADPLPSPLVSLTVGGRLRMASLWKLERTDNVVFYFTDHDEDIVFEGHTYTSRGSFNASARQKISGLKVRNSEMVGFISSDVITHADLSQGKYRDAKLTEYLVDWDKPFAGAIQTSVCWLAEINFTGETWTAQVQGITRRFNQNIGRVYGRTCDYILGSTQCGIDLDSGTAPGPYKFTGTVTAIVQSRLAVRTTLTNADGYFKYGYLLWGVGAANEGVISEIKESVLSNGRLDFALRTPVAIVVGDAFTAIVGCDKIHTTCRDKFDNAVRFGGFPFVPGTDRAMTTPNNKA